MRIAASVDGVERLIKLRARVRQRLIENAEVVGSDERFFDDDTDAMLIRDLYTEQNGILDDDGDTEVDLSSHAYQIWKNAIDAAPRWRRASRPCPMSSTQPRRMCQVRSRRAGC